MKNQTCESCGKLFSYPGTHHRKFCSKRCHVLSLGGLEERNCPICGELFRTYSSRPKIFCSQACCILSKGGLEEKVCPVCSKSFKTYSARPQTFCSRVCFVRNAEIFLICELCGKRFRVSSSRLKANPRFCSRRCYGDYQKTSQFGENNASYKGGSTTLSGYLRESIRGRSGMSHRFVVEGFLGRILSSDETVHHIDGDRKNNKIENLYLFSTKGAHQSYHLFLRSGKVSKIEESNLLNARKASE